MVAIVASVAGAVGVFGLNDLIEIITGNVNIIRDYFMFGSQKAYDVTKGLINGLGSLSTVIGLFAPKIFKMIAKTSLLGGKAMYAERGKFEGMIKSRWFPDTKKLTLRLDITNHNRPYSHHHIHYHIGPGETNPISIYSIIEKIQKYLF